MVRVTLAASWSRVGYSAHFEFSGLCAEDTIQWL